LSGLERRKGKPVFEKNRILLGLPQICIHTGYESLFTSVEDMKHPDRAGKLNGGVMHVPLRVGAGICVHPFP